MPVSSAHANLRLRALQAEVLWLVGRRTSIGGRAARQYDILDTKGSLLLAAHTLVWSRELTVHPPAGEPVLTIVRNRTFPLTGRAAVNELPAGSLVGTVSRDGSFRDPAGAIRGKFVDARSLRERTKASLLQGGMDALLAAGDDVAAASGPRSFVLQTTGGATGTLIYGRLPFAEPVAQAPGKLLERLPLRLRRAWTSIEAPRGWKLQRTPSPDDDPRLLLAGALFAADLAGW